MRGGIRAWLSSWLGLVACVREIWDKRKARSLTLVALTSFAFSWKRWWWRWWWWWRSALVILFFPRPDGRDWKAMDPGHPWCHLDMPHMHLNRAHSPIGLPTAVCCSIVSFRECKMCLGMLSFSMIRWHHFVGIPFPARRLSLDNSSTISTTLIFEIKEFYAFLFTRRESLWLRNKTLAKLLTLKTQNDKQNNDNDIRSYCIHFSV